MDDKFASSLKATSAFFSEYVARLAADGIDRKELDDLDECLDAFKTVIQEERERIEQALEDAGGRDVQGDLNRAQEISMPIFSRVPDLKYGEGYCEKHDVIYYLQNGKHCPNCELEKIDISGVKPGWKSKSMSKGNI